MKRLSLLVTMIALIGFSAMAQQPNPKLSGIQLAKANRTQLDSRAFNVPFDRPTQTDTFGNLLPCDTDFWYFPYDVVGSDSGYLFGHNIFIDSAKAEKYEGLPAGQITGVWLWFAVATFSNSTTQKCHIKVWDNDGPGGLPGTVLGSVDVTHASINNDVTLGQLTTAYFSTPINLPADGNVYVGVQLDYKLKNGIPAYDQNRALSLVNPFNFYDDGSCNDVSTNTGYEKWSDGSWHAYSDVYGAGIRNIIFPIVQSSTGCTSVSVNPTSAAVCKGKSVVLTASGATTYSWAPSTGLNCTTCSAVTAAPSKTTTYTVTGDGGACSTTVKVTVNKPPTVTLSQAPCSGGAVVLTANSTPATGVSYQWYKGATAIAGATNKTYSATQTKSYKCAVTITSTGCSKTSASISVTINCKVDQASTGFDASVYPNPFSTSVSVNIATGSSEEATVVLLDYTGRIIREYHNVDPNSPFEINESLSTGIYFVKVIQGTNEKMLKVVKND